MNINKFTQKSLAAVQGCEKLAYEYGNQQMEQALIGKPFNFGGQPDFKADCQDGDPAGAV